jgi:nucleotide-binding universal stress UspA family protein
VDGDRVAAVPEPNAAPTFHRAVIALSGHPNGTRLIQLVAEAGKPHKAELVGVHVVEVDWSMPLDADLSGRSEEIQQVLDLAETTAEHVGIKLEPVLLQARDVGAALVDEAVEREADLLVVGLAYRTKFGGDFAIGRTIPYVLKNAPCAVWVVREPIQEENA